MFPSTLRSLIVCRHTRIEERIFREKYSRLESVHENLSVIFIGLQKQ